MALKAARPSRPSGSMKIEATNSVMAILAQAKLLAQKYRQLTGRPLGITGEVAEYEAVRLLGLDLAPVRTSGYDAIEYRVNGVRRLQIKGRCVMPGCSPGQRLGSIDVDKQWDAVLMVLLDENFNAFEIYEAPRDKVVETLARPGSKARNERSSMGVRQFKA